MTLAEFDLSLLRLTRTRFHARTVERGVGAFSRTGEHALCWFAFGLGGAGLAKPPERALWLRGVAIVAASYAANFAVKVAVRRRRPQLADLPPLTPTVSALSFPSAHASTSFAAARAFSRVAPSRALYGVAGVFALSRPYLGVHYPSDVVAGAALGTAIAAVWPA